MHVPHRGRLSRALLAPHLLCSQPGLCASRALEAEAWLPVPAGTIGVSPCLSGNVVWRKRGGWGGGLWSLWSGAVQLSKGRRATAGPSALSLCLCARGLRSCRSWGLPATLVLRAEASAHRPRWRFTLF